MEEDSLNLDYKRMQDHTCKIEWCLSSKPWSRLRSSARVARCPGKLPGHTWVNYSDTGDVRLEITLSRRDFPRPVSDGLTVSSLKFPVIQLPDEFASR